MNRKKGKKQSSSSGSSSSSSSSSGDRNKVPFRTTQRIPQQKKKTSPVYSTLINCGIVFLFLASLIPLRLWFVLGTDGTTLPDDAFQRQLPKFSADRLEVVLELPIPPGNVAVASNGRVIFNFHPEFSPPDGAKIAQCLPKPNSSPSSSSSSSSSSPLCEQWSEHPATHHISSALSLRIDQQNRLWVLDFNNHAMFGRPSLVMFQLGESGEEDVFQYRYEFPHQVAPWGSFLNDLQVSPDGEWIYIVDTGLVSSLFWTSSPALLVHHIPTNTTRRFLQGHKSVLANDSLMMTINDHEGVWPVKIGPFPLRVAVDSLALDRKGEWLYYGAMTGDVLYRIPTEVLKKKDNGEVAEEEEEGVERFVEVYSQKPISDGLTTDNDSNIYVTAMESSSIAMITAKERKLKPVVKDQKRIRWPDGFSFGPDNYLYITSSASHYKFAGKDINDYSPFFLLRLPVAVGAPSGH